MRYQADCWGTLSWYKCHETKLTEIFSYAVLYLHALKSLKDFIILLSQNYSNVRRYDK